MKPYYFVTLVLFLACQGSGKQMEKDQQADSNSARPDYAMVIHGGAGVIPDLSNEQQSAYKEALNKALDIGEEILNNGGSSLDAVVETIKYMEDNPLFNAGKGAVFTHDGVNELDASIMDGRDLSAGAVGGVTNVRYPITAARAVMEHSAHVFLSGRGAEQFAREQGLDIVDPSYFFTEHRWNALQLARENADKSSLLSESEPRKFGTVGVVALDRYGNLAAGTSTGGMTNKKYNRIGDSPVIGAGTYANNSTCAVSSTGHGEFFIRFAVAHDISAIMEYTNVDVQDAADKVVMGKLVEAGGDGGVIGVDRDGIIAMSFNTPGMHRGYVKPGERFVAIYK